MKNVLLIDSGSGGVNVLKECVSVVPHCNYLLFCDDANLPYGNKSKEELIEITIRNLQNIYKFFKYDIVIFACNTLTSVCLDKCREIFDSVIFIGTVPAVKPALQEFKAEEILVLATENTIKYNKLINKTSGLQLLSMPTLAFDIDENIDCLEVLEGGLRKKLKKYHPKAVVLGCTHYLSVKNIISNIFSGQVQIFDSANGVARRLKSFVENNNVCYQVQIISSKNQNFVGKMWWHFNQN